jgi:hypothetical protein
VSQSVNEELEDCCNSVIVSCCCKKLVAEVRGHFGNQEEGELPPLEVVTKQQLGKTEDFMRAVVSVIFGVCNSETAVVICIYVL